jgi:hypothetical protein
VEENNNLNTDIGGGDIDEKQFEKILSMVRLIKGISQLDGANGEMNGESENGEDVTSPDDVQALNVLNAALPYLDYKFRKPVGIMVKLIEMNRILSSFETLSLGTGKSDAERKRQMLLAVRDELDSKKQQMLDIFMRVMEIREIAKNM